VEPLIPLASASPPRLRREAILALARLQYLAVGPQLKTEIRAEIDRYQKDGTDIDLRLIYASGQIQRMELVPLLAEILRGSGSTQAQELAAWALFQHIDQRGGREVTPILEERLPSASFQVRCAIVHSLGYTGDERSNLALVHVYNISTPEQRETKCELVSFHLRPDGGDERIDLFAPSGPFEKKILQTMGQIRATDPAIRATVEPWLERMLEDDLGDLKRSRIESLLLGIRKQRDDREQTGAAPG
jgi:hypothetical protein